MTPRHGITVWLAFAFPKPEQRMMETGREVDQCVRLEDEECSLARPPTGRDPSCAVRNYTLNVTRISFICQVQILMNEIRDSMQPVAPPVNSIHY